MPSHRQVEQPSDNSSIFFRNFFDEILMMIIIGLLRIKMYMYILYTLTYLLLTLFLSLSSIDVWRILRPLSGCVDCAYDGLCCALSAGFCMFAPINLSRQLSDIYSVFIYSTANVCKLNEACMAQA